jgi:hypothetical protein
MISVAAPRRNGRLGLGLPGGRSADKRKFIGYVMTDPIIRDASWRQVQRGRPIPRSRSAGQPEVNELYRWQMASEVSRLTGADDLYEPPRISEIDWRPARIGAAAFVPRLDRRGRRDACSPGPTLLGLP